MTNRERKYEHTVHRIWTNELFYLPNSLLFVLSIMLILAIIGVSNSVWKLANSKCADGFCETALGNCSLCSVMGERVILQVQRLEAV